MVRKKYHKILCKRHGNKNSCLNQLRNYTACEWAEKCPLREGKDFELSWDGKRYVLKSRYQAYTLPFWDDLPPNLKKIIEKWRFPDG